MPTLDEMKAQAEVVTLDELPETYCSFIESVMMDMGNISIDLSVVRWSLPDKAKAGQPKPVRVPTCRLILPAPTAVDLFNRLSQVVEVLKQQGLITQAGPGAQGGQGNQGPMQ
jgi:hypothetical protein